ncbi:hypothetical protein CI102_15141 [Trichoderma harzianum]|nr:hypothetical protein CI102_15141 [Trichoderma harzianum]
MITPLPEIKAFALSICAHPSPPQPAEHSLEFRNAEFNETLALQENAEKNPPEKRFFGAIINVVFTIAEPFFPVEVGLLKFVGNSVNLGVQCIGFATGATSGTDCIIAAADLALNGYMVAAAHVRGRAVQVFHNGVPGTADFQDLIRNRLNDTHWVHIASSSKYSNLDQQLHIKHADKSVLGPSSRSKPVFHVRVNTTMTSGLKRNEGSVNGLVFDYLWDEGNESLARQFMDSGAEDVGNDLGFAISGWMEENSSEANCASLAAGSVDDNGDSDPPVINRALAAYGWNNQAFQFNGRAGGWIDQCGGPF